MGFDLLPRSFPAEGQWQDSPRCRSGFNKRLIKDKGFSIKDLQKQNGYFDFIESLNRTILFGII